MEEEKKDFFLTLRENVLKSYKEYYKDDKHNRELPNIFIKNNKSNKFLKQLEEDLKKFLGEGNHPKIQTIGDFFYKKTYVPTDTIVNSYNTYIKEVNRVLHIRELKTKFIKLISNDSKKLQSLIDKPYRFVEELELNIREAIEIQDELNFRNDLISLFTDESKHYQIKESSLDDINAYILHLKGYNDNSKELKPKRTFKLQNILIMIALGIILISYFNPFEGKEKIATSTRGKQCSSTQFTGYPRLIILPFGEKNNSKNNDYGLRLYNEINKIIQRDNLSLEVIYCDIFKNYTSIVDARRNEKKFQQYINKFRGEGTIAYIFYDWEKDFDNPKSIKNFKEFKKQSVKSRAHIYVYEKFNDEQFLFDSYHQTVLAIVRSGIEKDIKKGINYINNILLSDSITKDDSNLLEIRSRLKRRISDENGGVKDLNKILSLDSTNIMALYTLARIKFNNLDTTTIKTYDKLFKLNPTCSSIYKLAKSYAIFQKDFKRAHQIIDGNDSIYRNGCRNDNYYEEIKGELYLLEEKYDKAINILKEGYLIKTGKRKDIGLLLSRAYFLNKEYKKAEELLIELKKLKIIHSNINNSLAFVYYKMGNLDLALKHSKLPNSGGFDNSFIRAHLLLKSDSINKAIDILNTAIPSYIKNKKIKFLLNYRRIANNRANNKRLAMLDSLKILDYDSNFFIDKKWKGMHPSFKFPKIFNLYHTKEEDVPLITK